MTFTLTIRTDGAAFDGEWQTAWELARILHAAAERIHDGENHRAVT